LKLKVYVALVSQPLKESIQLPFCSCKNTTKPYLKTSLRTI